MCVCIRIISTEHKSSFTHLSIHHNNTPISLNISVSKWSKHVNTEAEEIGNLLRSINVTPMEQALNGHGVAWGPVARCIVGLPGPNSGWNCCLNGENWYKLMIIHCFFFLRSFAPEWSNSWQFWWWPPWDIGEKQTGICGDPCFWTTLSFLFSWVLSRWSLSWHKSLMQTIPGLGPWYVRISAAQECIGPSGCGRKWPQWYHMISLENSWDRLSHFFILLPSP